MKRDFDFVHSILIYVETAANEAGTEDLVTDSCPFEIVAY